MVLAGFAKPRSFLYLAPAVAALLTLYFDRQARQSHAGRTLTLITLVLALSVSAIANVNFGTHPFKRNSVIPYQSILDFIHGNANGSALDHLDRPGRSLDAANERRQRMRRIFHGGPSLRCRRAPL